MPSSHISPGHPLPTGAPLHCGGSSVPWGQWARDPCPFTPASPSHCAEKLPIFPKGEPQPSRALVLSSSRFPTWQVTVPPQHIPGSRGTTGAGQVPAQTLASRVT